MENSIDNLFRVKIEGIKNLPKDVSWSIERGWIDYQNYIEVKRVAGRRKILYLSSIAAMIAIVVLSSIILVPFRGSITTVSNNTNEVKTISLPNGNKAWLNKNSSITYPSNQRKGDTYEVKGELFFEITDDEALPLTIIAFNSKIIIDIPAEINVKALLEASHVDITVKSGSVKVVERSYDQGLALLVTQESYCSVHRSQKLVYSSVNTNLNYMAWKTGTLTFDEMPMATVVDILSEYYSTQIQIADAALAYCLFSGSFHDKNVNDIINHIRSEMNLEVHYANGTIIIAGKRCL